MEGVQKNIQRALCFRLESDCLTKLSFPRGKREVVLSHWCLLGLLHRTSHRKNSFSCGSFPLLFAFLLFPFLLYSDRSSSPWNGLWNRKACEELYWAELWEPQLWRDMGNRTGQKLNSVTTEASTNPTGNCKAGWPFRESMIDLGSVTLTGGGG